MRWVRWALVHCLYCFHNQEHGFVHDQKAPRSEENGGEGDILAEADNGRATSEYTSDSHKLNAHQYKQKNKIRAKMVICGLLIFIEVLPID